MNPTSSSDSLFIQKMGINATPQGQIIAKKCLEGIGQFGHHDVIVLRPEEGGYFLKIKSDMMNKTLAQAKAAMLGRESDTTFTRRQIEQICQKAIDEGARNMQPIKKMQEEVDRFNDVPFVVKTHGRDTVVYNNGATFTGKVNDKGFPSGKGTMTYPNGVKRTGTWSEQGGKVKCIGSFQEDYKGGVTRFGRFDQEGKTILARQEDIYRRAFEGWKKKTEFTQDEIGEIIPGTDETPEVRVPYYFTPSPIYRDVVLGTVGVKDEYYRIDSKCYTHDIDEMTYEDEKNVTMIQLDVSVPSDRVNLQKHLEELKNNVPFRSREDDQGPEGHHRWAM